jgi:hypothetical protein
MKMADLPHAIGYKTAVIAVLLSLAGGLLAPLARAQETQVPLDRSGRIQRIDSTLAKRLGMLVDRYPGFTEARLFRAPDSTFVLEVTMARGGQILRERVPMSAAGADSLRGQVSALVDEKAPSAVLNQEGRALLVSMTTLLGLGFYGWALPYAADASGETAVGIYLVTAGGSFILPFLATGRQPVTYGMADHSLYGATRGIAHGILFYQLFAGNEGTSQGTVGSAFAGSVIEGVGGYAWARGAGLEAGSTTAIGALGDFGLLEGLGVVALADYYDQDKHAAAAATMLVGSAAGLAAGSVLASRRDFSYGDARIMRDGMLLSSCLSLMVVDWFSPEDKGYVTAAMIGGVAGLVGGDLLVRDTEFTAGQSWLVTLGMVAGGAVGLGIGYLTSHDGYNEGTALLTAGTLGATLGYGATYASFRRSARESRVGGSSWQLELSPLGLVAATSLGTGTGGAGNAASLPLVRARVRF